MLCIFNSKYKNGSSKLCFDFSTKGIEDGENLRTFFLQKQNMHKYINKGNKVLRTKF